LSELEKQKQAQDAEDAVLSQLRTFLHKDLKNSGLEIKAQQGSVTLGRFVDSVRASLKQVADLKLTPGQEDLYERYREIKKKSEISIQSYDKAYPYFR
jgi:hypothetical protein